LALIEDPIGRSRMIEIVPYDPTWPERFVELGAMLRRALKDAAVRIDHVGSTAVPGLASKPVVDIQISVASFEPLEAFKDPLEELGYIYRPTNTERTKRYFREPPGTPRTHVHVRLAGSFSEQFALLFRDYLRATSRTPPNTKTSSAALQSATGTTAALTRGRRRPSHGNSSAAPTGGPKRTAGSRRRPMPDLPGDSCQDVEKADARPMAAAQNPSAAKSSPRPPGSP
jgi:GrpB-like predicted nucleotidyltransferase (UPF0157 family)